MSGTSTILTVGHSNHPLETFAALLTRHRVTAVADVRSAPYSRYSPQFNRGSLAAELKARGIDYVYLGGELGGRSDDPACYEDGRIRYDRLARTPGFQAGFKRVVEGATHHRIALMCAEKDPLDCHRTLLVARALDEAGIDVGHIRADGELERHAYTMDRLIAKFNLQPEDDLFRQRQPRAELIAEAVALQAQRVAFVADNLEEQAR